MIEDVGYNAGERRFKGEAWTVKPSGRFFSYVGRIARNHWRKIRWKEG
jgi:hypothetical protein